MIYGFTSTSFEHSHLAASDMYGSLDFQIMILLD